MPGYNRLLQYNNYILNNNNVVQKSVFRLSLSIQWDQKTKRRKKKCNFTVYSLSSEYLGLKITLRLYQIYAKIPYSICAMKFLTFNVMYK